MLKIEMKNNEEHVVILAPTGQDGSVATAILSQAGMDALALTDLPALCSNLSKGAGAVLIAEEALNPREMPLLHEVLRRQPPWSDIPIIILTSGGEPNQARLRTLNAFGPAGNVTLLERPFRSVSLVSVVQVALRARRRQYEVRDLLIQREAILASISDGFVVLDTDWKFGYVNERAAEMFRSGKEEMNGKLIWDFFPEGLGIEFRAQVRNAMAQRKNICFEEYYPPWNSWLEYRTYPASKGLSIFIADISGRKKAEEALRRNEEQLRQSQKMEAIGRLAGGIAHDFNNLLTAINGYSELVLGLMKPDDVLRDNIEEIRKAGERAAALTRQLLAYSRQQMMAMKILDLNEVVKSMESILRRLIGEDIEISVKLAPGLKPIKADPGQMEQVILNLSLNARDAMPQGGKLTLLTYSTELKERQAKARENAIPGTYTVLAVKDTGIGMDTKTKDQIFEPFFTTKHIGKGTGLGLSTVHGIIHQSGGHITVASAPGKGSTFEIFFPSTEGVEEGTSLKEKGEEEPPGERETILVVEDEAMVLDFISQILRSNGYNVLTASKGMEALMVSADYKEDIHLLLTDVVMPGMSGRELAEALVEMRSNIKVLYVSGYTDDAILHHGVLDGKASFMNKPFSPSQLMEKVRSVLEGNMDAYATENGEGAVDFDHGNGNSALN